jgi:hypothetical protein
MGFKSTGTAALTAVLAAGTLLSGSVSPSLAAKPSVPLTISTTEDEMKDTLFKLVRQDEYLDETIDMLNASTGDLSSHEISKLGLTFKAVKGSLDAISTLNKEQFFKVQPSASAATYAMTILSYSRSVSQKAAKINSLFARTAVKNKKSALRDAVFSKKSGKVKNGKKIELILEEQKAQERLASDLLALRASAKKLNATSKWLYLVSK